MKQKVILIGMLLVLVGLIVAQFSLKRTASEVAEGAQSPGEGAIMARDDPAMQEAYNKSRKSLDYFLGVAQSPPPDTQGFALKVGVQDEEVTEFFWVYPFNVEENGFSGRINSEPELVDSVFKGEIINFSRDQIVDWTFEDRATGIMHGNFTGCVTLQREAPDNVAQFQELYGLNCEK